MGREIDRWPLVGRSSELAVLHEELGRSASVVLTGAVGVGKSSLVAAALERLQADGRPTVVVRATRSTASIPFGAFARWVPERLSATRDWLGVLQGTAAALLDEAPSGAGLVVVVDDAQLLDDGSAALVLHLAQHTPAAVLVAVRTAGTGAARGTGSSSDACPDAVEALAKEWLARRIDLRPLSQPDTTELVRRVLGGEGEVGPAVRQRLWQLTQGNPMYLREVVDAGRAQGVLVLAAGRWRWQGALAAGRSRLVELVGERLAAGGPEERRALEVIALGEPLPVAVLARLAPEDVLAGIEARGLVVTEPPGATSGEGPAVRLAHPLYSEVVRSELLPFTARRVQRDLARAAIAVDLHRRDPLRVATWMLDGGDDHPDPDLMVRAALVAQVLDEFDLSTRLAAAAERAGAGPRATLVRAESLGPLRRLAEAEALLAELAGPDQDPEIRASAVRVQADLVFWHQRDGLGPARRILAEAVETLPPAAHSSLLVQASRMAIPALDLDESVRLATSAVAAADTVADRLQGLSTAALASALQGRTELAIRLVMALVPHTMDMAEDDPVPGSYTAGAYSFASVLAGRVDEAVVVFETLVDHELVSMYRHMAGYPTYCLARAYMAQGRVATAARLCQEVMALVGDENHFGRGTWVGGTLAAAAAQAGDADTAGRAVAWLETHTPVLAEADDFVVRSGQAWWRASIGELSAARELALEAAERAGKAGAPSFELLGLLDLVRLGDAGAAAERLEELATVVDGPLAQAAAAFGRAAVAQDGAGLDDASARFAATGSRLLAAEAAALAATVHRARGRKRATAASLTTAQRLAASCEGAATPLLAALDQEPLAAALSRREREVAELAARGRASREIAEALHLSLRTVDSHLDHAYTKLGITSRRELPAALGLTR